MSKITFNCKGKLSDGSPCDKKVSTKMHTGVSEISKGIKEVVADNAGIIIKTDSKSVPDLPSDWEFTLICSRGHEEDYSYVKPE